MSKKEESKINSKEITNWKEKTLEFKLTKWEEMPDLGLYMDQVLVLMEKYIGNLFVDKENFLTPSMINNYVKLGVMSAPISKKYSREHLVYLTIICLMKQALSISSIKNIIENELAKITINELYDKFCGYYEEYLTAIIKGENIHLDSSKTQDNILKLGIVSNICRLVSDIEIKILEDSKSKLPVKHKEKKKEPAKKK